MSESAWKQISLGDLADVNPEALGSSTPANWRFRYIDIASVTPGKVNWENVPECEFRFAPSRARRIVRPGDTLFCTVRPGLRAHAHADWDERDGIICSTGFAVLRPRESDRRFIFHTVFSNSVVAQVRQREVGSSYPAVNESDLKLIRLKVPERESEREQIAEILDTLDAAIRETAAVVAKLRHVKDGLLHDLLTRGLDEQGHLRDPARHPEQFQESPLGRVPKCWDIITVERVGSVTLGRQRSPKHEHGPNPMPYLRVANVFDGWIDFSDVLSMNFTPTEQRTFRLDPGDILLNEGQSLELVGRSAIYQGSAGQHCFQNTLVRFRCFAESVPEYCQAVFKRWLDTGRFTLIAKQTTSVAHLGADRFAKMDFARPPRPEQEEIAKRLATASERITAEESQLSKLQSLKRGLAHDLLTGRVRVKAGDKAK